MCGCLWMCLRVCMCSWLCLHTHEGSSTYVDIWHVCVSLCVCAHVCASCVKLHQCSNIIFHLRLCPYMNKGPWPDRHAQVITSKPTLFCLRPDRQPNVKHAKPFQVAQIQVSIWLCHLSTFLPTYLPSDTFTYLHVFRYIFVSNTTFAMRAYVCFCLYKCLCVCLCKHVAVCAFECIRVCVCVHACAWMCEHFCVGGGCLWVCVLVSAFVFVLFLCECMCVRLW